ncbi:ABZJ_00895 family protein [Phyllobacterium sp. K27]
MDESVALGRYYWHFSWMFGLLGILASVGIFYYEQTIGPVAQGGSSGLSIGLMLAAAIFVVQRFLANEKRVPTSKERRRLAWVSFGLSLLIPLIIFIVLEAFLLLYYFGLQDFALYRVVIVARYGQTQLSKLFADPSNLAIIAFFALLICAITLWFFFYAYGSLAEKLMVAWNKSRQSNT